MKKPIIWFVCSEPNYNLFNRRSAIDSILCSILKELKDSYTIIVNGEPFVEQEKPTRTNKQSSGIKSLIKSLVPFRVKEYLKIKFLLNTSDQYKQKCLLNNAPDVIIELYKLGSNLGSELSKSTGAPLIIYYDSPVVEQYEDIWGIITPCKDELVKREKESVRHANAIIAYSNPVKEYLRNMGATGDIHIFQTLDYSRLSFLVNKRLDTIGIGFIGSFMPWHKVDLLLDAFALLKENTKKEIKLHLIGKGETWEKISEKIQELSCSDDIILHGFLDGNELNEVKKILHIGLMPGSNWYGIPTKVFEYGAANIAAIAPDTPTISDIFNDQVNIELFKWNDSNSLYQALKRVVEDDEYRNKISSGLHQFILDNHKPEIARKFYNDLIRSKTSQ